MCISQLRLSRSSLVRLLISELESFSDCQVFLLKTGARMNWLSHGPSTHCTVLLFYITSSSFIANSIQFVVEANTY